LFMDVITTVCEKVANSVSVIYWPCIRLHDRVRDRVDGHVHGPYEAQYRAVYTVVYTACTLNNN